MYCNPADMSVWRGRVDGEPDALRYHQAVKPWDSSSDNRDSVVLLGFACDEGVKRNKGRVGAKEGPAAIRRALACFAWHHDKPLFDSGDIDCDDGDLEIAQQRLADHLSEILNNGSKPIVLGGGHEVAWGSFLGLTQHLEKAGSQHRVGIINLDAHFDLRAPSPDSTSGTPFHQIATWCDRNNRPFNYMALGISPVANTRTLFRYAEQHKVKWRIDAECTHENFTAVHHQLEGFVQQIEQLYFTVCLDAFAPNLAPGVSAPSSLGIDLGFALRLIEATKKLCEQHGVEWQISDIAELNPSLDHDNATIRLAARLVDALI